MRRYKYEIFLGSQQLSPTAWREFLLAVQRHLGSLRSWQIQIAFARHVVHYYLFSPAELPASLQFENFLIKPTDFTPIVPNQIGWPLFHRLEDNCIALALNLRRRHFSLQALTLTFNGCRQGIIAQASAIVARGDKISARRLILTEPATLLSVDFTKNRNFAYKKFPKYLNLDKTAKIFQTSSDQGLLAIDPFPYGGAETYLQLEQYDFARHSLILGGSGMGKSKFIANFIQQLYANHRTEYQVVVIDPHDALKHDLAHLADRHVVDFSTPETSIDLFATSSQNLSASIELLLGLFRSLIADNYNSRLERVLRFSIYLLSTARDFNFGTLRHLLTDLDYRQQLLNQYHAKLPDSVAQFFLTDFQELKTKSYGEAIAPIIAFIDEMQMVPAFSQSPITVGLAPTLADTFLTIFSLNRLHFGDKVVRTLAGLLMQQLFLLAQGRGSALNQNPAQNPESAAKHLLIIIDEVAVVENPILPRFLSELRKFGVSVILAGQYFAQISPELHQSIFANIPNFYLFRVSRTDANLLAQNLEIKLMTSEEPADQAKLLASLKARECLVQITRAGKILPIFPAKTLDYITASHVPPQPIPLLPTAPPTNGSVDGDTDFDFAFDDADIGDIMSGLSTSRRALSN